MRSFPGFYLCRGVTVVCQRSLSLGLLAGLIFALAGCAQVSSTGAVKSVPPTALSITINSLPSGTAQSPYSATLTATGGDAPYGWSVTAGALPAGLTLTPSGIISGTPTGSGSFSFTVQVKDSSSMPQTASASLKITVATAASAVQITTSTLAAARVGMAYSASLAASGGTSPYSWSITSGSLPAGLSLNPAGKITGAPTAAGTESFTVQATDSSTPAKAATANLSLTVAGSAPLQITTSSLPSGKVGALYSATLSVTGGTSPYGWALAGGALPGGLALDAEGRIGGTPTASGTTSFIVRATDSSTPAQSATASLSLTVTSSSASLQITTSSLPSGQLKMAYSATLAASGGTTPYKWSISSGALPAGLTVSGGGVIGGTPTTAGTSSFTVQVQDSSSPMLVASKALNVTVSAPGAPLLITTTSLPDGQVNSTYSTTLATTGGTTPYMYSISSGSLPAGISLNPSDGQISGLPTASGTSSFTVSVKDSSTPQQTNSKVLSIFIAPSTTGTSITSCETLGSTGTTYTLENDVSASGTCFTIAASNVSLNLNGHTVTYNTAGQGSPVYAIVDATGNSQGVTVYGGTLTEGSGSAASGSHVIDLEPIISGPTIHNVIFNWSAPFSQAINTDYGNNNVAGGAQIYSNTLNNNNTASCDQVSCRDLLQSTSIRISDAIATSNPPQIYSNTINGGPQGGIECDAPGCVLHDNIINPGTSVAENSNDFAIYCWAACNAYNNTIMTPLTANSEGRGIQLSGVETSTSGANVHNNTVTVFAKPNDTEYGGCELGGAYGIQFDDNGSGGIAQNNNVTAVSDQCWGSGLRLTDTETQTNISENNIYLAIRKSSSSPVCTYIGGGTTAGCAHGVSFAGPLGFLSRNDSFQGDSDDFFFDYDGASGVTFISPTFLKGATNLSPNFHTFVFRNGGTVVSNIHVRDPKFGAGTSATDTDLPAQQGGVNAPASMYIDWSQTITVDKSSGGAASGATVSFTDAFGTTYSGITNGSGEAVVVVTQYRLNNDSGANGIENHNPYSRGVSLSGCTTNSTAGLTISGTGSAVVTLGGC